jgi:hypothetical protein
VKGDIASAIAIEHLNATLGKQFRRRDNVIRLGVAAQGDDGRVLKQEEYIADASFFAKRDQLLLHT